MPLLNPVAEIGPDPEIQPDGVTVQARSRVPSAPSALWSRQRVRSSPSNPRTVTRPSKPQADVFASLEVLLHQFADAGMEERQHF
eukprot:6115052-Alexandrium_andersonii.AAC.1